jgi:hypothetical protein
MRIAYATNPAVLTALAQQPRSQQRNAAPRGNSARGGRGGRGRGGSRRSEGQTKKSQEELDAEMDSYMQAPPVCIVKFIGLCQKEMYADQLFLFLVGGHSHGVLKPSSLFLTVEISLFFLFFFLQ